MEITPTQIRAATFKTSRKGYDPDEVRAYLGEVAQALEECQQHATAMEARARAAVSRLQEYQAAAATEVEAAPAATAAPAPAALSVEAQPASAVQVSSDESETISRTLLLAQRTADTTVAEAQAEAERLKSEAKSEAEATLDSSREMSAKLVEDARTEARDASADERQKAENEVEALKARREFLVGDVDQLETFLVDQRERLRGAARQIEALCERVPSGLGEVRRPPLSASDDVAQPADATTELFETPGAAAPFGDTTAESGEATEAAAGAASDTASEITAETAISADDPTQAIEITGETPIEGATQAGADDPRLPLPGAGNS